MNNKNFNNKGKPLNFLLPFIFIVTLIIVCVFALSNSGVKEDKDMRYDKFMEVAQNDSVVFNEINVSASEAIYKVTGKYEKDGADYRFSFELAMFDETTYAQFREVAEKEKNAKGELVFHLGNNNSSNLQSIIFNSILLLVIGGVVIFFIFRMSKGNSKAFDFGKSSARMKTDSGIKFNDVAGCEEEKAEMVELVEYLKEPAKFTKMGARIPKGVLLTGAPGTGKTLLAKAVAGEAGVPFYFISGSDFVEMFVGVGASRVRDMFQKAKMTAPSMVFIDEIDAVGRQRGTGLGGGHDEREQTLNQLLVEMDGFNNNTGVIVIAATNRADVLDPALLRPGRFDRQITVALPDKKGREAILRVHARNKKLNVAVDLAAVAGRTQGSSGAQLENMLNEAAIMAVRNKHTEIMLEDIDEGMDRVWGGPAKKSKVMTPKERKLTAYHESGHALIGLLFDNADIVRKVTIIPRGDAGGYTMMGPEEDRFYATRNDLLDNICGYLGGRVAEEIFFVDVSTGAYDDIKRATRIARAMVTEYGMSSLGPIQFENRDESVFLGRDYASHSSKISGQTAQEIDREVQKIISQCLDRVRTTLEQNKEKIVALAEALLDKETLLAEDIERIAGISKKKQA